MKKEREKMPISERAKQFMPFSPLSGLGRAIAKKEEELCEKKELTEEKLFEINETLALIKKGDFARIVYYSFKKYIECSGVVKSVDKDAKLIEIAETTIKFDDIKEIEKL